MNPLSATSSVFATSLPPSHGVSEKQYLIQLAISTFKSIGELFKAIGQRTYTIFTDLTRHTLHQCANISFNASLNSISFIVSLAIGIMTMAYLSKLSRPTPPAKRYVEQEGSSVGFADVIGMDEAVGELRKHLKIIHNYAAARKWQIEFPKGILFHGPPGTGKTLLARAFAAESKLPFYSLEVTELRSAYMNQTLSDFKKRLEDYKRAAPCIIFIDEVDMIARKRDNVYADHPSNRQDSNLLGDLLTFMSGLNGPNQVYFLCATNTLNQIDPAFIRAGRLDNIIEIPLPNLKAREKILDFYFRQVNVKEGTPVIPVDQAVLDFLPALARITEKYSGAALRSIWEKTKSNAFVDTLGSEFQLGREYRIVLEHLPLKELLELAATTQARTLAGTNQASSANNVS